MACLDRARRLTCFMIVSSCAVLSACQSTSDDAATNRVAVYPALARVTFKGEPVEGAVVRLVAPNPNQPGAAGRTDDEGKCRLTTYEADDGAAAGNYMVLISKVEAMSETPASGGDDSDEYVPPSETPTAPAKRDNELPPKYNNPARTPLNAVVTSEGPNEYVFELNK
ncbi:hypothetical protein Pan44_03870 [Caulifigura coniformis]|uniref:Carboxypeptidase regulatory-like domain-containing protein n=1 Tax=Caulifigura coniformis TaxID=2527983 RepID=A0A517S8B8_9PLAN|nr:hypothetical protein [Caulifigura coniformis]QDT52377.1 hypothetical protein Pan44_03870 [Caulifigura coniformis]